MKKPSALVVFIVLLTLVAGCMTPPTSTSVPPTVAGTRVPPTASPVPPAATATSLPSASAAAPTATPATTGGAGDVLTFYSERDGNGEIYLMNADGTDQRRLTDNDADDFSPVWSPPAGGTQIAFTSDRDDANPHRCFPNCTYQIYLMNADGAEQGSGDQRRLTNLPNGVDHPAWSPDGTMISFDADPEGDGTWAIYVIDVQAALQGTADGAPRPLTDGQTNDRFADWSPDGTRIAFSSNRDGNFEIYVMDVDGAEPGSANQRRLTNSDLDDYFPAWSPDGKQIAFFSVKWPAQKQDICIMNADGTDVRKLTDTPYVVDEDPAWSPDGKQIAFQSDRDGNFEVYVMAVPDGTDADGTNPQRLTNTRAGDYWPAWKPAPAVAFEKSTQTFPPAPTYQIGLGDLDGDGDLDAVFANSRSNPCQVWLNDGTGQFVDTGQRLTLQGHGVSLGDLDGDGDLDALITCHENVRPSRVYLNDGHAVFQDSGQPFDDARLSGNGTNLADVDADGDLDAIIKYYEQGNLIYLNDGSAHFARSEHVFPAVSVWGDLDADGDVDVFFKEEGVGLKALLNDGTGAFSPNWTYTDTTITEFGDIALGDTDHDGDLDAIVPNGDYRATAYPTRVFLNDGTGRFVDSEQQLGAVRNANVGLGDLDDDGDVDLVLTDYQKPNQVWLNDGAGRYTDSGFRFGIGQFYRHVHLGDLDGDGDLDVFLATFGSGGPNEIWFNQRH
ncbi:MAG: VCBS repeat-containing protein [Chloroflexi bacterium]|nr:VCBS repeat-containing protein [Chloroflexota bacterium]MBU1751846.1 VCBS repeat-containing protein [Chloroflexota bacterium]